MTRVRLAQWFPGWTLDYIDNLIESDPWSVADILGVIDADKKLENSRSKRA